MNILKSTTIISLSMVLLSSCKENQTETAVETSTKTENSKPKKEIAKENLQTANLTIKGMTCEIGCSKTIQDELNGLEGVQSATVDFKKEQAMVSFDKTILSTEKITKVIEAAADGKSYKVINMNL